MNKLSDKDGLERDIAKLQNRIGPWWVHMKPHVIRYLKWPSTHNGTNLCTESSRADDYVNGHIFSVYYYLSSSIIVVISALLIWKW
jgi:hypothetical protein